MAVCSGSGSQHSTAGAHEAQVLTAPASCERVVVDLALATRGSSGSAEALAGAVAAGAVEALAAILADCFHGRRNKGGQEGKTLGTLGVVE